MPILCRHRSRAAARHITAFTAALTAFIAVAWVAGARPASAAPTARSCQVIAESRVCTSASISLSKRRLTAVGGFVTIRYASSDAARCTLRATPAFWRGPNPAHVTCRGRYRIRITPARSRRSWTFTFTARNRFGRTMRVARSLVATAPPAHPLITPYNSSNWSGYAIEGAGFTGVQGTFTIPALSPTTSQSDTSEWVGIDGVSNAALIQAGAHENFDPNANGGAGGTRVYAWWEILPDAETPISTTTFPVAAGDLIAVRINKITGKFWRITLTDARLATSFSIVQAYNGPETSAEWIVEAPTYGTTIQPLGDFSTTPIFFSGLAVNGVQMAFDRVYLWQQGYPVSSPSNLLPGGFTVTYQTPKGP